jgi:quercetin dioxygenase-like cupin family protein
MMVALAAASAPPQAPVLQSAAFDWNAIPATETKVGSVRSFFKSPTATLEELELHVTTLNPGQEPHPPHRHPNEEMVIVREGTVEALVNGDWKRVGPGSVIFNASNQLHGLRNPGSVPATYHVINWKTAATPNPA